MYKEDPYLKTLIVIGTISTTVAKKKNYRVNVHHKTEN
jgi:hypothetical protein